MASTLTIGAIKTEIRSIFGGRTDLDSRLNGIIDLAQDAIARLKDFDELRARTTIDTAITANAFNDKFINIATLGRLRKIYSIRLYANNTLSRKLRRLNPKRWDEMLPKPEYYSRRTPTHYIIWKKTELELFPVPDIVYTMHFRYSVWPAAASVLGDGGNSVLENMDSAIIFYASSYIATTLGDLQKSQSLYSQFSANIKDVLDEEVQDFDTFQAVHGSEADPGYGRGYDDPFVREMP